MRSLWELCNVALEIRAKALVVTQKSGKGLNLLLFPKSSVGLGDIEYLVDGEILVIILDGFCYQGSLGECDCSIGCLY